jgi:hypothetical protein
VAAGIVFAAGVFWFERAARGTENPPQPSQVRAAAHYVGSGTCVSCHSNQEAEWRTSQHHDAMAEATEEKVLGNFNNAAFTYAGTTSTFFKRDGRFLVRTDGRDGTLADFDVK